MSSNPNTEEQQRQEQSITFPKPEGESSNNNNNSATKVNKHKAVGFTEPEGANSTTKETEAKHEVPPNSARSVASTGTNHNNNNNNNGAANSSAEPSTTVTPVRGKAFNELVLAGETLVKTLTNPAFHDHVAVVVKKVNGEYVVRKAYPSTHRRFTDRAIVITKLAGRHPCCTMPLAATRHKDYSVNVEEEFSDGADLHFYLERVKTRMQSFDNLSAYEKAANKDYVDSRAHQVQFAKAVARQLVEYVFWLETVMCDSAHGNINPRTILLRRDGSIKMKFFNYFTKEMVEENPNHYYLKCAYASPECSRSVQSRMEFGYKNDVWAIGAVLFSIITGDSYLPEYSRKDPYKLNTDPTPAEDASSTEVYRGNHNTIDNSNDSSDSTYNADTTTITAKPVEATEMAHLENPANSSKALTRAAVTNSAAQNTRAQQDRAQSKKYEEFMKFVDEASLAKWFERVGDPALAFLIKWCLTRDRAMRPTAERLLCFMYVSGTGMIKTDYSQPSATFEQRSKLAKIVVPGRAYERIKNAQNVEIGWSMVLPWNKTYDAWGTDMAQLSQAYRDPTQRAATDPKSQTLQAPPTTAVVVAETLPTNNANVNQPASAADQARAADHKLFGEQLYLQLHHNLLEGGGPYRMYQHMLLFSTEVLHFSYPLTADVKHLEATFVRRNLGVNLEGELNSLTKIVTGNYIGAVLEAESRAHHLERNKSIGENKVDTAARTAIDKQRREVIKGRLSCSMIAMSRAMCFLRNGYMESKFPRMLSKLEEQERNGEAAAKTNTTTNDGDDN